MFFIKAPSIFNYIIFNQINRFSSNLSRKAIVIINRLRYGHNSLKSSLFRFKIIDNDKYSCGLTEDENHIL